MSDISTIDQISKDAQSFGHLLDSANKSSPLFAKALLGSVDNPAKTQAGTLIAGLIAALATSYGLNWSDFTVLVVTSLIMSVFNTVVRWWQIRNYRKILPTTLAGAQNTVPAPTTTVVNPVT